MLLPKPQHSDIAALGPGQVLWGWPHCVQDTELTQIAIDQQLTLIAFEAMNHWTHDGYVGLHVFHKNNEIAGYCSVLQADGAGRDHRRLRPPPHRDRDRLRRHRARRGHGAQRARRARGRGPHQPGGRAVGSPIHSVRIRQFDHEPDGVHQSHVITERGREPLAAYLAENDIIVNCTLQDTARPLTYLQTEDLTAFRPGSVIVDVSCDLGMGFSWARPTTFDDPTFEVGNHVLYYAVDHSPSYLWNSATWDNSNALIPFIRPVLEGSASWDADETLRHAIEIREGRVINPSILAFQGRSPEPPYALV